MQAGKRTTKKAADLNLKVYGFLIWLAEDDAYQIFLEDEFDFEITPAAKGHKRFVLPAAEPILG